MLLYLILYVYQSIPFYLTVYLDYVMFFTLFLSKIFYITGHLILSKYDIFHWSILFYIHSTYWSLTNSNTTDASSHMCNLHYHQLPLRRLINDIGLGSGSWVYFNMVVTVGSEAELSVHGSSLLARCNIHKLRLTMANGCKYVSYWLHNFPQRYPKYEEWITTALCLPSSL